jgi:hypothetical protein
MTAHTVSQHVFGVVVLQGKASITIQTDALHISLQGDRMECTLTDTDMTHITAEGHAIITEEEPDGLTLSGDTIRLDLHTYEVEVLQAFSAPQQIHLRSTP